MSEQYANDAQTTLMTSINASATFLNVTSASAFPTSGNFRIRIDNEILLVTAVSGATFTVSRAVEACGGAQAAASHAAGAAVVHILTAASVALTGGAPGGSAGGDLSGTYPSPTVSKINGAAPAAVATSGAYSDLTGTPTSLPPSGSAGGDLTGSYPNPTLHTSGVTAGTYGDGTHTSQVSIDAKGRVTAASSVAITAGGGSPGGSSGQVQYNSSGALAGAGTTIGASGNSLSLPGSFAVHGNSYADFVGAGFEVYYDSTAGRGGFAAYTRPSGPYLSIFGDALDHTWGIQGVQKLQLDGNGQLLVHGFASSIVGLVVQAAASQTANVQEWRNSSGTAYAFMSPDGAGGFTVRSTLAAYSANLGGGQAASFTDGVFSVNVCTGTVAISYVPGLPSNWSGGVSDIWKALDRLASALAGLLGGAIP